MIDIQNHVFREIPDLEAGEVSKDTLHLLMHPPQKDSSRAHHYKCLIDAKVSGKRNQYREGSPNQHFLFARVACREDFVSRFENEASSYSCDEMNKIKMRPSPAVS